MKLSEHLSRQNGRVSTRRARQLVAGAAGTALVAVYLLSPGVAGAARFEVRKERIVLVLDSPDAPQTETPEQPVVPEGPPIRVVTTAPDPEPEVDSPTDVDAPEVPDADDAEAPADPVGFESDDNAENEDASNDSARLPQSDEDDVRSVRSGEGASAKRSADAPLRATPTFAG